jgi:hypothetical protein
MTCPTKSFPFPPAPLPLRHRVPPASRVQVRVGRQKYAIDITAEVSSLPANPISPVQNLRIETRFLRLRQPAALGDRIEGWRVSWLGGWDKGKVFFVVMAHLPGES